jgi:hypothetical protein
MKKLFCDKHGVERTLESSEKRLRCKKCTAERTTNLRRQLKNDLVRHLGGECKICGYNACTWVMHFHHRDAASKEYVVARLIMDRKRKLAFEEVEKCDLLCANCHGEEEARKWGALV